MTQRNRRALYGTAAGYGLVVALAILLVQQLAFWLSSDWARDWAFGKGDLTGYLEGARRFLETGSPYAPWSGLGPHTFIHPPVALALFVPFLWLPAWLWWVVPLVGTGILLASGRQVDQRPVPRSRRERNPDRVRRLLAGVAFRVTPADFSPYRLALILACLAWPRSIGAILAGNSDMWVMFGVALGLRFGWPMALLAIKPTFLPLAALRWRSWKAGVVLALASLVLLPLWVEWFGTVTRISGGLWYSLGGLPLVLVPVIGGLDARLPDRWRDRARGWLGGGLPRRGRVSAA